MAKIKSPEEAIEIIISAKATQKEAEQNANFRLYNRLSDKIWKMLEYLKETGNEDKMLPLLQYEDRETRFCAASFLFDTDKKPQAIVALQKLKSEGGTLGMIAIDRLGEVEDYTPSSSPSTPKTPMLPRSLVSSGARADGLIGLADMFSRPDVSVFKVTNFFEAEIPAAFLLTPTPFELIPDEDDDSARFYFIKALQVFSEKTVPCYMSIYTDERLTEFVVKQTETGIVLEEMDAQEHSVIPAIASDRYGRNSELYYAEENPKLGFEILKSGLKKARDKEIVKDDMAMLKDEIEYRRMEKK